MPEKQPKRPNNNAKALENWESEGGAPASDDRSTTRKRPRDLNQITKAQPLTYHKQKPASDFSRDFNLIRLRDEFAISVGLFSASDAPFEGLMTFSLFLREAVNGATSASGTIKC